MITFRSTFLTIIGFGAILIAAGSMEASEPEKPAGIPPNLVAEYIYSIVQAHRAIYATHVVERLQDLKVTAATEEWRERGALPLPAQLLQMVGREVQGHGLGLRIRLASLWPISEKNGPADELERAGLEAVAKDPKKPSVSFITRDGARFFQAIYADRAVTRACIECHNSHPLSPKRDYKLYDVMGGIIVSFPAP